MKEARQELVRVDDKGVAHPIGTIAGQRMRAREGAYRLLPAPEHVIFMRYTGEDGRRDAEDGAIIRLSGEITAPGALCDVFAMVAQTGWRGELVVLDGVATRSVFFESGAVVGVQTTAEQERIGMVLYKFGVLTEDGHAQVMERVAAGKRFGSAAVDLGLVKQEQVYQYLSKQIEEVVYASLIVSDGTFFFLDGFDDARLVARHTVRCNALLMDVVTRMDEMRYFREKIPSSDYVPYKRDGAGPPSEEYEATFEAVDGLLSVEDIGRWTGRGEVVTTKDVYALIQSKHVGIHPPREGGGLTAIVALANEALKRIHQVADSNGRGSELRQHMENFAAGAGVYDMLFRGAGPDANGGLDPGRVSENVSLVADGAEPEYILKQMLYDYVGFAIFSAGALLGEETEAEISRQLGAITVRLQPGG